MGKLDTQDGCLDLVEPAINAKFIVVVFPFPAVYPQRLEFFCEGVVICGDKTAVAVRAQILRWKKAETADIADRAQFAAADVRSDRLRAIFHDCQPMLLGDSLDLNHLGGCTIQMDRQNGLCSLGYRAFD